VTVCAVSVSLCSGTFKFRRSAVATSATDCPHDGHGLDEVHGRLHCLRVTLTAELVVCCYGPDRRAVAGAYDHRATNPGRYRRLVIVSRMYTPLACAISAAVGMLASAWKKPFTTLRVLRELCVCSGFHAQSVPAWAAATMSTLCWFAAISMLRVTSCSVTSC
jgi:hypothetical protein